MIARSVFSLMLASGFSFGWAAERYVVQVEDFEGPWRRQTNIPGYLGQGFCTSNANPEVASTRMRTSVEIQAAGRYAIWLRGFTSANSRRAMQMEVANQRLAVTHQGTRRRWVWEEAGEVDLPVGSVALVIHDADVGFETADAVLLTADLDEDPSKEERLWVVYPDGMPDRANALKFNIEAGVAKTRLKADPESGTHWKARREVVIETFQRALGFDPWPPKTPLQARLTGRCERDGYTIENLLFQSKPHFYVTANLYLPQRIPQPLPAVIVTAGHAMQQGKNYDLYRTAQLGLVRRGFVVLAYDPIGQGERRRPGNSHQVSYAALLTGKSNLHYMTWDTIRAVDYLLTRREVDPQRIGLTGNSGGGLNTMYAMPVEPRLAAGASFCCLCSYEAWIAEGGNHCICNHLPGAARDFEQYEFVGLCSPRPFLAGNGAKDTIFPVDGVRKTMERARRIYQFDNAARRAALRVAPFPHGWSQPLREAAYGWFDFWLRNEGDGSPLAETPTELEDWRSKDLQVLKDGQLPPDAKSYLDLVREEAAELMARAASSEVPTQAPAREAWTARIRERLWQVLGGRPSAPKPVLRYMGRSEWSGHSYERVTVQTEATLEVPAVLIRPLKRPPPSGVVIMLDDQGKHVAGRSRIARDLLSQGMAVMAMDPRGLGEVKVPGNHCASDAIVLGRPLLAQQAWDVICVARALATDDTFTNARVYLYGRGDTGLIAVIASALSDSILAMATEETIGSYLYAIDDPLPKPLWVYAPNLLKVGDVPDLIRLCAPRPCLILNPSGAKHQQLTEAEIIGFQQRTGFAEDLTVCLSEAPEVVLLDFFTRN